MSLSVAHGNPQIELHVSLQSTLTHYLVCAKNMSTFKAIQFVAHSVHGILRINPGDDGR